MVEEKRYKDALICRMIKKDAKKEDFLMGANVDGGQFDTQESGFKWKLL